MELKSIVFLPTDSTFNERVERDLILKIIQQKPETFIFITPGGHVFTDALSVDYLTDLTFNDRQYKCNLGLLEDLQQVLIREAVPAIFLNPEKNEKFGVEPSREPYLERFISLLSNVYEEFKCTLITPGDISAVQLLEAGRCIRESVERVKSPSVLVVFSDMLKEDTCQQALETENFYRILEENPGFSQTDDYNALLIGLGATDMLKTVLETFSNEKDICYLLDFLVNSLNLTDKDNPEFTVTSLIEEFKTNQKEELEILKSHEKFLQRMIRETIRMWLTDRKRLDYKNYAVSQKIDENLIKRLEEQRTGVFVSIIKDGKMRGSMGTINPVYDCIGSEVVNNALEAAFNDPGFVPLSLDELDSCVFEVDVLDPPEEIESPDELDPEKYGIIIEKGFKRGIVLPGIREVNSVEEQIDLARSRAGIVELIDDEYPEVILRFTTESF